MFAKLAYHLDFNKLEARNMVLAVLSSAPSSPVQGQGYYDSTVLAPRFYDGAAWGLKATDSSLLNGQNAAFYLARANHTGTQLAATISDLAATVQAYRLDQFTAPTGNVSMGNQRIVSQADPVNPQDSATKNYVDNQVSNAAAGIDSKPSVRLTTAGGNSTLSGLSAIDGVTPVAGDRILVPSNTTATQNGVYVAAAGAWVRAADADQTGEITSGATWFVEEGTTYGATTWRVATTGTITLGSTSISITQLMAAQTYTVGNGLVATGNQFAAKPSTGISVTAAGIAIDTTVVTRKAAATIGNGSATSISITHGLNSQDITWTVRDATTNEFVGCKGVATDVNTLTLTFAAAPASNSLKVAITG